MAGDDYVDVTCVFKRASAKAVLVADDNDHEVWVPRSVLHGADDTEIDRWAGGQEVTIRVREWFAEREDMV